MLTVLVHVVTDLARSLINKTILLATVPLNMF